MSIAGIFDDQNLDADDLKGNGAVPVLKRGLRRETAELVTKGVEKFYRYNIISNINHGLARQDKPLPSSIPIQITFNRAKAAKGLIKVMQKTSDNSGDYGEYPEPVVKLTNPILKAYFVESAKAESYYGKSKMYDVSLPFLDYSIRRELLMDHVKDFNLKLYEGPLPSYVIMGFMSPKAFEGDFEESSLRFQRHGLKSFEIRVDSQPIELQPLKMHDSNSIEFFYHYLRSTNR